MCRSLTRVGPLHRRGDTVTTQCACRCPCQEGPSRVDRRIGPGVLAGRKTLDPRSIRGGANIETYTCTCIETYTCTCIETYTCTCIYIKVKTYTKLYKLQNIQKYKI